MSEEMICTLCNGTRKIIQEDKELCKACGNTKEEIWCKKHLIVQKELLRIMEDSD